MRKSMTAEEAKTNFGALLDLAQQVPITISRQGRPLAVVSMQEYEQYEALKLDRLRREIAIGMEQIERGETVDGKAFFEALLKEPDRPG